MNRDTQQQLLSLNSIFYTQVAQNFSHTRERPWPGWNPLLEWLPESNLKILDVGCGNGRFGNWITTRRPNYQLFGIEPNPTLAMSCAAYQRMYDLSLPLSTTALDQTFDVICLFGVLHHIPSYNLRIKQLEVLFSYLNSNGILVATCWQPLYGPLSKKMPDQKTLLSQAAIDPGQLEPNDLLLDFQHSGSIRYCHHFDLEEQTRITQEINHQLLSCYCADGFTGRDNTYFIWKKVHSLKASNQTKFQ